MYEAVIQEDVNLVLANLMFISFLVLLGMILADIILALVDPRIKSMYVQKSGKKARHKETDEAVNASAGGGN